MINNRQGGRRRGRGGQRPQGMPGNSGNQRDNRQRGNAAQLLEKYKNMARDAQLAGDRVQTEYYLQFADHYFRILSESRARFEEQRRGRDDEDGDDDGDEMMDGDDGDSEVVERPQRRRSRERDDREERPAREDRPDREERGERPQRRQRANGGQSEDSGETTQRMPFDALPPAIGADDGDEEEAPRPARRPRRPRNSDGDSEGAAA